LLVARLTDGISAAAQALTTGHQPAVPIINGADRLAGTLTRADMISALYNRITLTDAMAVSSGVAVAA
jgi:CBS domain-containing membrane protein